MKKLAISLMATMMAGTGMALVNYGNSVHWTGTGDWMDTNYWMETAIDTNDVVEWVIPGWVVGNPANTNNSTDLDWNGGYAHIDSGTVNVTPASHPDGSFPNLYMGSNVGDSTLNLSDDLTVRWKVYMGYQSLAGETATINQTAGNVVLGREAGDRTYMGRGFGTSIYNLSGGTLATPGDWDQWGNNADDSDDGTSTFVFNQTGGTYTDTGASELVMADKVPATAIINVTGGTFKANATTRTRVGGRGNATINIGGTGAFESSTKYFDIGYYDTATANVVLSNGTFSTSGTYFRPGYGGTGTFTQLGGSSSVSGLVIGNSAGSTGTFNLSGGSCTVTGANARVSWQGGATLNVSGGTLNVESDFLYVGSSSNTSVGVFNLTGGEVVVNRLKLADLAGSTGTVSISGGSLVANNYIAGSAGDKVFEVVGSGATKIETDSIYFWEDAFRVKLDENGSTLVKAIGGTYYDGIDLRKCVFEVDTLPGFAGMVGDVYDIMWTAQALQVDQSGYPDRDMIFTNLSDVADFSWAVVSKDGGSMLQLTVVSATSQYDLWAEDYGLSGGSNDDDDGDGLSNLYEFGVGGNPTNPADQGISSSYAMVEDSGTNWMTYVYPKQSAANSGLAYYLELTDNLVIGPWINDGYTVTGIGAIDTDFDAVTNRISTATMGEQFIRLVIEQD